MRSSSRALLPCLDTVPVGAAVGDADDGVIQPDMAIRLYTADLGDKGGQKLGSTMSLLSKSVTTPL